MSLESINEWIHVKTNRLIVLSDEYLYKLKETPLHQAILESGRCIVMMSRLTKNTFFKGIDFYNVRCGRSAAAILNKIKYFCHRDRVRVGVFMPNSNYNPQLSRILLDTPHIEYISYPFFDVPALRFDYLINMATKYRSISLLTKDEIATTVFDNYRQYEDKFPDVVCLDRFKNGECSLYRLDFIRELEIQCDIENKRIGKPFFKIPWTEHGRILDLLLED